MSELNATQAMILGILATEDTAMSGHDIFEISRDWMGGFWNSTRSQIYRELPMMVDNGLIRSGKVGTRNRVPYKINAKGRRMLTAWLTSDTEAELLRVPIVLRVSLASNLPVEGIEAMVVSAQDHYKVELRNAKRLLEKAEEDGLGPWDLLALRFHFDYSKMMLNWLGTIHPHEITSQSDEG